MLLAAGGMVKGHICYLPIPTQEIGRLPVDVQNGKLLIALEHVQPPFPPRLSCLGRLAVFHHCATHCVRVCSECAREAEIHPLLLV